MTFVRFGTETWSVSTYQVGSNKSTQPLIMLKTNLLIFRVVFLTLLSFYIPTNAFSDSPLEKEDKDYYREFVRLLNYGPADEFYRVAAEYESFLKKNGKTEEYFKIKTNEGFFDLAQQDILRGMKTADQLEKDIHEAGATQFYYLVTGLKADLHKAIRSPKSDSIYRQALIEVADRDPKFSMLAHMSLAQVNYMTNWDESFKWADMALEEAERLNNFEYRSMSLGLKCYLYFMMNKKEDFLNISQKYIALREQFDSLSAIGVTTGKQRFSHRYDLVIDVALKAFEGEFDEAIQMAKSGQLNVDRQMVIYCIHGMEGQYEKEQSTKKLKWGFGIMTALYIFVYLMGRRRLMLKLWERQAKLRVALDDADAANRMKSAFIRSMSHEIRTPLNAINGFSQILCSPDFKLTDDEKDDMRKRITSNAEAITIIINELLELAAGESVTLDTDSLIPVRINEMCRNTTAMSEEHNNKGLKMEFRSKLDDSFAIKSNEETVSQILEKVIDNAIKFTEKGEIIVETEQKGNMVEISVSDTGIGIPPERQNDIFDNFVKLDEFKEGIGLGLSISRRLAKSLNGNLILDTEYKKGSRFILQLPVLK